MLMHIPNCITAIAINTVKYKTASFLPSDNSVVEIHKLMYKNTYLQETI
jgi:hypothetical protein